MCFFEQLCAIAVLQRTVNLPAVFTLAGGKNTEFQRKFIISFENITLISKDIFKGGWYLTGDTAFMDEFPKTISSKVMRKDLRAYDETLKKEGKTGKFEFFESDFAKELNLRRRK
ncbi:MAG: hypothetical protein DSY82_04970 [Flavobacteriia bacterium]|nr:MAG: hypothetical protein DSY82_04970 [Flavobacteriia bacterium]